MSIEALIQTSVKEAIEKHVTAGRVETIAFDKFSDKIVKIDTVADILGVHPDTVRSYVKYGIIKCEPRPTDRSPYRFQLSEILKLNRRDLR